MTIHKKPMIRIFTTELNSIDDNIAILTYENLDMPDLIMVIDSTLELNDAIIPMRTIGKFCHIYMLMYQHWLEIHSHMPYILPDEFAKFNIDLDNPIGKLDLMDNNILTTAYYALCNLYDINPSSRGVYHIRTKSASDKDAFFNITVPYTTFHKSNMLINGNIILDYINGNINESQLMYMVGYEFGERTCEFINNCASNELSAEKRAKLIEMYRQQLNDDRYVIHTSISTINGVNTIYSNSFNLANVFHHPELPEIVAVIASQTALDVLIVNGIILTYYERMVSHYNNGGSLDDVLEIAGYYVYSIEVDVMSDNIRSHLLLDDLDLTHLRYRQLLLKSTHGDENKLSSGHYIIQTTSIPSNVVIQ